MLRAPCQISLVLSAGCQAAEPLGILSARGQPGALPPLGAWPGSKGQRETECTAHLFCPAPSPVEPAHASSSTCRVKGWDFQWLHLPPRSPAPAEPAAAWITAAAPAPAVCFAKHWLLNASLCSSSHSVQMTKPCTMSVWHGCWLLERIRLLPWQSCQVCGRGRARLCSHAPKAVKKPENTAQSDVNKQVLHILPSQIFRSLKRIGCVIESSRRQLYPVLPALTQPITQSFTWQLDRVTCFHMGEQFSDKALQPEHWKPHCLVPWTLISTG